jgi:hypothetical protein
MSCARPAAILLAIAAVAGACAADPGEGPKEDAGIAIAPHPDSGGVASGDDMGLPTSPPPTSNDAAASDDAAALPEAAAPIEASPPPPSCTTCPLTVLYFTEGQQDPKKIYFDIAIQNNGSMPQALSELTVKYWFTAEGATPLAFENYYAAGTIQHNIDASFETLSASSTPPASAKADTVMDLTFGAAAGSIPPMSNSGDIQIAIHQAGYQTTFDETNDFSYTAADTKATCAGPSTTPTCETMAITIYRGGAKVYGDEP